MTRAGSPARRARRRALVLPAVAVAVGGCGGGDGSSGASPGASTAPAPTSTAAIAAPAEPRLSAARLAGEHVILPFDGVRAPVALLRRLRRGEAAGVILLGRNVGSAAQLRALTRRLRSSVPLGAPAPLIMVDQEGGTVKRLPGAPSRGAPEMAATGDTAVARAEGLATARTLRAAGVNVDLAPVVDVARPDGALAAEGRGFGAEPAAAGRFGAAFVGGLRAGGVAATAKHFPGFGAAPRNTDFGETTIGLSARTLRAVDGPPFRAAVRAGVDLVMFSSAVYPALSRLPAVLSRRVVEDELRGGVGFTGVTVSDDLEAPAFAAHGGAPGATVGAARAGVDLLLFARSYAGAERATRALAAEIRAGRLDRTRLEAGVQRIRALRARLR
ncbi:MAG: beta-N-acetylhexosaminidase [Solirubrobacteraceae bacterium]|nr:beta-N-acetylhexosaminidase [Solirubrobacteraceae bacterium]